MTLVIALSLTIVAIMGTVVTLTERPDHLALTLSGFGLTLALLFMALQAPDVALSQIGVGTAIVPLMVMLTYRAVQRHKGQ